MPAIIWIGEVIQPVAAAVIDQRNIDPIGQHLVNRLLEILCLGNDGNGVGVSFAGGSALSMATPHCDGDRRGNGDEQDDRE